MKSLLITCCLALLLSTALSAQPFIEYSVARMDTSVQQHPSFTVPGNVWGGSTGKGTKWCNTLYYNGICIWRLTDASVFAGATAQIPGNEAENVTVQTIDNQKDNITSALNGSVRYIIVRSTNATSAIIAFDSTVPSATKVGGILNGEMMFDETNPGIIYARVNHTQIKQYTSTDGWNTFNSTDIYDFANCLPPGYTVTWQGTWGTATRAASPPPPGPTGVIPTLGSAFSSDLKGQGSGYLALAYRQPVNGQGGPCASIDTFNSIAYGWNGQLLGPLDDGNGGSIPAFKIHDGGMTRNPNFFGIAPDASCGNCANAYIWEIGTTHVRPCTNLCDGHGADGYMDFAAHKGTNSFMLLHPFSGPNYHLIGPLLTDYPSGAPPNNGYDEHASWLNAPLTTGSADIYPIIITTTVVTSTLLPSYSTWGEDEIIGISADPNDLGLNEHWRFGQTGNSGLSSQPYTCQNAKGTVAVDGSGIAFTSDMASDGSSCPLGCVSGQPRCDVFWMELK